MPTHSSPHPSPQPAWDRTAFLQEVREVARLKHLSIHTEDSYAHTIRRFLEFHGRRHPRQLGAAEVRDYLTHLAVERTVAASTQNVARNALLFLFREVLGIELPALHGITPAKPPLDKPCDDLP